MRLSRLGCAVCAVVRGDHGNAIRQNGLKLVSGNTEIVERVQCVESIDALVHPPDVVVVAVKQNQLPVLAAPLGKLTRAGSTLVFAMNGVPWWFAHELLLPNGSSLLNTIDPALVLSKLVGRERLVNAVVQSSNEVIAPGVILNTTPQRNRLRIGWIDSPDVDSKSTLLDQLSMTLTAAGYETSLSSDVRRDIWNKMSLWLAVSPLAALLGRPLNILVQDPQSRAFMVAIMREMVALGRSLGFEGDDLVEEKIDFYFDKPTKPSILKDVEMGRPLELANCVMIFDEIVKKRGFSAPNIALVSALARLRFGFPSIAESPH